MRRENAHAVVESLRATLGNQREACEPVQRGELLAQLRRGSEAELRLAREEYTAGGRQVPYLSLRLWQRFEGGPLLPTKKGISIRISEIPSLIEALLNWPSLRRNRNSSNQEIKTRETE